MFVYQFNTNSSRGVPKARQCLADVLLPVRAEGVQPKAPEGFRDLAAASVPRPHIARRRTEKVITNFGTSAKNWTRKAKRKGDEPSCQFP